MLAVLPLSPVTALGSVVLVGLGAGLAGEAFYKLWPQEMFPTRLRATAQGLTFAVARAVLAGWSILVPLLLAGPNGLPVVAGILAAMLVGFGLLGALRMPDTAGRSIEEIDAA